MFIEDWSMDDSFCHHFPGQPRTTATQADCWCLDLRALTSDQITEISLLSLWHSVSQGASLEDFLLAPSCSIEKITLWVGSETKESVTKETVFAWTWNRPINAGSYREAPVCGREATWTSNDVTLVKCHYSSSLPLFSPGPQKSQVPILGCRNRRVWKKTSRTRCLEPEAFSISGEHSNHSATVSPSNSLYVKVLLAAK